MAGAMILLQQFGAENVARHQVGGELDPTEVELQRLPKRTHQQRLAKTRNAFQQAVTAGEQADQQLFDHVGLADDRLADRGAQVGEAREAGLDVGFGEVGHDRDGPCLTASSPRKPGLVPGKCEDGERRKWVPAFAGQSCDRTVTPTARTSRC